MLLNPSMISPRAPGKALDRSSLLKQVKCFILDLDGTVYLGNQVFPFSKPFLKAVEQAGKQYYFFTNNSSQNASTYVQRLKAMGIPVDSRRMLIANQVLIEYLQREHSGKSVYILGTPALRDDFREAGIRLDDEYPDIVVIGFDTTLNYEKLRRACDFVRGGCLYYGVNPDLNCPVEGGAFMPDCGSIARLIEASTGRRPEFFGKPTSHALSYVSRKTGFCPDELAFIGDRLYTDIAIAHGTQAVAILVLTGESTREDAARSPTPPDIIALSLKEVAQML